jgi:predicted phage-related endonuclease
MDFENKVKDIDEKIAKLKKQREALCAEAIDKDFAYFVQRTRTNTPNLSWWREQYPRSWEKYVTKSTYNKFAWKR